MLCPGGIDALEAALHGQIGIVVTLATRDEAVHGLCQPHATVLHTVDPEQATLGYLTRRSFEEGLGKATLARLVGSQQGLESERRHLLVTIPRGMLKGLGDALRGDPSGIGRTAAIAVGVLAAACGYAYAKLGAK